MSNTPRTLSALPIPAAFGAIVRALPAIEFTPDGEIVWVNDSFAQSMGYAADELVGMHHRTFCLAEFRDSASYAAFWQRLRTGDCFSDRIRRLRHDGTPIWLEATYAPVRHDDGSVIGVIKIASDIDARERQARGGLVAAAQRLLDHARVGRDAARAMAEVMRQAAEAVDADRDRIGALSQQARHMADATQLIRDVAAQTNLLALNAAIEAARAGAVGRGFAVVSDEVRVLAGRARTASTRIDDGLESTLSMLHESERRGESTRDGIGDGLRRLAEVLDLLRQIESAADELFAQSRAGA